MYRASCRRFALTLLALCLCAPLLSGSSPPGGLPSSAGTHSQQRTVYLTFDDGPSDNTDAVLDILLEENIRATFFVVGQETEADISRYNRILEEGHALGLHSYSHQPTKVYASLEGFSRDFMRLDRWIAEMTGESIKICRMVGGSNSRDCSAYVREEILTYLYDNGYICYDWDIDSMDSLGYAVPASQIARNVISAAQKRPDQDLIVLLHDDALRKTLPQALPTIIRYFQEQDYSFATLPEDVESIKRILPKKHKGNIEPEAPLRMT